MTNIAVEWLTRILVFFFLYLLGLDSHICIMIQLVQIYIIIILAGERIKGLSLSLCF